jgi:hypothetical protein
MATHHANPPKITFPKKVGDKNLKEEVAGLIKQALHVLAPNMDFSEHTLPVILTRASRSTQSADGMVGAQLQHLGDGTYETDTEQMYMNLKIAKTDGTRDNAGFDSFEMVVAHEMVHYVQYMTKTLYKTAKHTGFRNTRPQFYTHWNAQQAQTIQRNVLNAVSGLDFGVEYMPLLKAYTEAHRTHHFKPSSHEAYMALEYEFQAFKLTPLIMQACGWEVSKDARRKAKEAREAYYKTTYRQAWRNKPSKKTMQEYNKNRRCRRLASR